MTLLNDMHTDWDAADNDTRPAIATLNTDGGGYWSNNIRIVRITGLAVPYINDDCDFGELRVHFNTDSWRPDVDGLIYSDKRFMQELQEWLTSIGLAGNDVSYSEQGMQGNHFVSCDVGKAFIDSWNAMYTNICQNND